MADFHELTPNPDEISNFWADFLATEGLDPSTPNLEPWHFGDSAALAEQLLDIVLTGPKRATASCVKEYEIKSDPLPHVGDLSIVLDGSKRPQAVNRSTDIRIGPLSSVDDQFAWDEGEGDRNRRSWLDVHTTCFIRDYERLGLDFHADIPVVFERFELIYTGQTLLTRQRRSRAGSPSQAPNQSLVWSKRLGRPRCFNQSAVC